MKKPTQKPKAKAPPEVAGWHQDIDDELIFRGLKLSLNTNEEAMAIIHMHAASISSMANNWGIKGLKDVPIETINEIIKLAGRITFIAKGVSYKVSQ